jgi:hypothetical protein
MKKVLLLKKWLLYVVTIGSIIITSCTKEETQTVSESNRTLKSGSLKDVVCDLIAGQTINVGQVIYSEQVIDGVENLVVEYVTAFGWSLSEVHLYVGALEEMPTNKSAIQIGQFPYSASNLNGVTTYCFKIPISTLKTNDDGTLTIAAHAVVFKDLQQETAWANCDFKPVITLKSIFTNDTYAVSDGIHFSGDWYCVDLGYNFYEGNASNYLLQSFQYPAATGGAGKVYVSDNGTTLKVEVIPNEGLSLKSTYLFVGTLTELLSIYTPIGNCPDYEKFPYQKIEENSSHVFSITISANNKSYMFSGSRWGWYSNLKF